MHDSDTKETNWKKTYTQVFVWGGLCVLLFYWFTLTFNTP